MKEKRKTINGDDLIWSLGTLGFEEYVEPLKHYLKLYREVPIESPSLSLRAVYYYRIRYEWNCYPVTGATRDFLIARAMLMSAGNCLCLVNFLQNDVVICVLVKG